MIQLFNNKKNSLEIQEEDLRKEIEQRAKINAEIRKGSNSDILQKIDQILDKVSGFENSKITAITELYLALESGDTKDLIAFLKKPETVVVKKLKKKVSTWNSK
jgi:SPX domain protein involved in polyphosphate accumulation